MSTRCNIIVKDRFNRRVYLYHHHDGYPEFVGACLADFLGEMQPWQIRRQAFGIANKLIKGAIRYEHKNLYTGKREVKADDEYEVTSGIHGDIEYLYVINCKAGTLRCYAVYWSDRGEDNDYEVNLRKVLRRDHLVQIPGWDFVPDNQNTAISAA